RLNESALQKERTCASQVRRVRVIRVLPAAVFAGRANFLAKVGLTVILTLSQPPRTACCSALPELYTSPATAKVRTAAAWKSESACSLVVSVTYQILPAFSHAYPPSFMAVE